MTTRPESFDESADWILAETKRQGFEITKDRLSDWHREGLISEPYIEFPGGGGSTAFYPAGTLRQATCCALFLKRQRSFKDAGWKLWMARFSVREDVWRQRIVGLHQVLLRFSGQYIKGGETTEDLSVQLALVSRAKRLTTFLGGFRRRLGKVALAMALELLISVFVGAYTQIEDDKEGANADDKKNRKDGKKDRELIGRMIGSEAAAKKRTIEAAQILPDTPSDFLARLETMSPAISRLQDPDFLANHSSETICAARDELNFLVATLLAVRQREAALTGGWLPASKFAYKLFANPSPSFQAACILGWLACRDIPDWREGYEKLLEGMRTAAASPNAVREDRIHDPK